MTREQMIAHLMLHGWEPAHARAGGAIMRSGVRVYIMRNEHDVLYARRRSTDMKDFDPRGWSLISDEALPLLYAYVEEQHRDT